MAVHDFPSKNLPQPRRPEPPDNGDMERIAKLESDVKHLQTDLTDVKADLRKVRDDVGAIRTTDFRLTFGAIIAVALGLAGLMAKGFHWL